MAMLEWSGDVTTNNTSFVGYLYTSGGGDIGIPSFQELVARLITMSGQDPSKVGDRYKTSVKFLGRFNGEPFTLYDYKRDRAIHIGGSGKLNVEALRGFIIDHIREFEPTPYLAREHYDDDGTGHGWNNDPLEAMITFAPVEEKK